jgi:hypothetical protein
VVFLCKHENRERYKRIELEDLESKVKRRKMATMDKEGLTIKARPLLSLGPASCEPGLLGIFLWYRPGLFQCRFDITFIGKSPIFSGRIYCHPRPAVQPLPISPGVNPSEQLLKSAPSYSNRLQHPIRLRMPRPNVEGIETDTTEPHD